MGSLCSSCSWAIRGPRTDPQPNLGQSLCRASVRAGGLAPKEQDSAGRGGLQSAAGRAAWLGQLEGSLDLRSSFSPHLLSRPGKEHMSGGHELSCTPHGSPEAGH